MTSPFPKGARGWKVNGLAVVESEETEKYRITDSQRPSLNSTTCPGPTLPQRANAEFLGLPILS